MAVVVAQACGTVAIALAGATARADHAATGEALFWIGVLLILAPTAWCLVSATPTRAERIAVVCGLGVAAYLAKVMIWPVQFAFHDEFVHWRTTADILSTHHLFTANPLTPVSPSYPGSEIITAAVAQLSGLSVFASGMIVVGVARLLLMVSIYLIFELITTSPRAAGIACLVYVGNPNFIFFDAQFAYESVGLSLACFLLYLALRAWHGHISALLPRALMLAGAAAALAMTHHLTSWLFAAGLSASLLISVAVRRADAPSRAPLAVAVVAAVTSVGLWVLYIGVGAVDYVLPSLTGGGDALLHLIEGEAAPRKLFVSAGQVSPVWEHVLAFAGVGMILAALPVGLFVIVRRHRRDPYLVFLALVACVYPPSLALRLTDSSSEAATRLSEFLFFGLACVLALVMMNVLRAPAARPYLRYAACTVMLVVVFGSGVIVGFGRWARLPGPYLVSADQRSIEPQGVQAAEWMRRYVGRGQRIAADRTNSLLMGSPLGGEQHPVNGSADGVSVTNLLLSTTLTSAGLSTLDQGRIRYLILDRRLSRGLPLTGIYVDAPEPTHIRPVSSLAIGKFTHDSRVSRLLDSGDINIDAVSP